MSVLLEVRISGIITLLLLTFIFMIEAQVDQREDKNQNQNTIPELPKKNRGWKGLVLILILVVLAGAGLYWNSTRESDQPTEQGSIGAVISEADIDNDFIDGDKRTKQEVVPPENIMTKYTALINNSLQAIKDNKPSSEDFKDLNEDYLTVATGYNILGDFEKAEESYKKMLEAFPNDYKANLNLGDLYISMKQYRQAGKQYLRVVEKYPADYRVYSKLATLYYDYAKLDEPSKIKKASMVYEWGIKNADDKKVLYKDYAFFAENYAKDYAKAADALREYQKITGSVEEQEIERLEQMMETR